jgi:hypothetical protein
MNIATTVTEVLWARSATAGLNEKDWCLLRVKVTFSQLTSKTSVIDRSIPPVIANAMSQGLLISRSYPVVMITGLHI